MSPDDQDPYVQIAELCRLGLEIATAYKRGQLNEREWRTMIGALAKMIEWWNHNPDPQPK